MFLRVHIQPLLPIFSKHACTLVSFRERRARSWTRAQGKPRKFHEESCSPLQGQITGVWNHVRMAGSHRGPWQKREPPLWLLRGQTDLRATCQHARIINSCIPIYCDGCDQAVPYPRFGYQFCHSRSNDSRRRNSVAHYLHPARGSRSVPRSRYSTLMLRDGTMSSLIARDLSSRETASLITGGNKIFRELGYPL